MLSTHLSFDQTTLPPIKDVANRFVWVYHFRAFCLNYAVTIVYEVPAASQGDGDVAIFQTACISFLEHQLLGNAWSDL